MGKLILLRHGTSQWNFENRFTGWTDVDLARAGVGEAHHAAELMKKAAQLPQCSSPATVLKLLGFFRNLASISPSSGACRRRSRPG